MKKLFLIENEKEETFYCTERRKFISYNLDCPKVLNTKEELMNLYNSNPYNFRNCEIKAIEPLVFESDLVEWAWEQKDVKKHFINHAKTELRKGYSVYPNEIIDSVRALNKDIDGNILCFCNVEFDEDININQVEINEE